MKYPRDHFSQCPITQPLITVFASGDSLESLTPQDIDLIKSKSFLITMNYAPVKYHPHMNIHSDVKVTKWLYENVFGKGKKDFLVLSRNTAFDSTPICNETKIKYVDYWFDQHQEKLGGNYTIVWLLQLIEKYFPNKLTYIFGLDMYVKNGNEKWYDKYTDFDKLNRGRVYNINSKVADCGIKLNKFVKNKNLFINCNPASECKIFQTINNWKEKYK